MKLDHKLRSEGITGSEIAAVAGLSRWQSPIDVWTRKVGLDDDEELDSPDIRRGNYLEDGLRKWYAQDKGKSVLIPTTLKSKNHPLVIATPDGICWDAQIPKVYESCTVTADPHEINILEIKSPRKATGWGESGTDEIPQQYIPQVIWGMAAAGLEKADVAALVFGELRIYPVAWNERLFGLLLERAEKFWHDHVLTKEPPAPDGSVAYNKHLDREFPSHGEGMIESTEDIDGLAIQLRYTRDEIDKLKEQQSVYEQRLKAFIGKHDGVEGHWGKITWRQAKDSTRVDWKAVAERAGASQRDIEPETKIKPGSRSFRPTWK